MQRPQEIVLGFLDRGMQVHPDVVSYISEQGDLSLIPAIVDAVPPHATVVLPEHIPGFTRERDGMRFLTEANVDVIYGVGTQENNGVDFRDFIHYFRDRFNRLAGILRTRKSYAGAMPIGGIARNSRYYNMEIVLIGMVMEVRNTTKGHRMAMLEDPTGMINVLFNKDREDFAEAERLIPDEVIAVTGQLSNDGNLFFANSLARPDIPVNHAPYLSETPGKAAFISDVHVGSDTFLGEAWEKFSAWLHEQPDIGYLMIAGDVVDGIGIYPDQDKELTIQNIYGQYEVFADMLRKLPSHIQIVVSPGNHDAVRGAEPQPALPPQFCTNLPENVTMVENPAVVKLQGVSVLMYHGRSFDDMIGLIPGASYTHPEEVMVEMLKRRHLTCTYGERTPIYASREDRLVIDPIPEILHTGHVHISGIAKYRGVLALNAGTWQSQTAFQKQMNIQPTPARAIIVDLQTMEPKVIDFQK
ncbi:DNA-directed DNA polymerase II small subunit [Methanogenium organophilum]|uniref:DNA polymerase II small subunit n=1 Tax=Methanogenium organophilum TaxID=2199 RepID=A0A9X9S5J2_METOG|nr:DNA-directed DNA polymerase II small subunit [Methanogenium organophilum]WAI02519.1 DNA-directed DNA polymerase II small subunit [Methanogenium organophilum]